MKFVFYHLKALISSFMCLIYVQKSRFCFLQDILAAILNGTFYVYSPDMSWYCPYMFRITYESFSFKNIANFFSIIKNPHLNT